MKRILALIVACACLLTSLPAMAAVEEYTVAEKLLKQLWAGSGFSGTLTLEAAAKDGSAFSTKKPIHINVDYIYVRADEDSAAQHRADLVLMDGEDAISAAYAQLTDGELSLQADVISPDWYSFAQPEGEQPQGAVYGEVQQLLTHTGMPGVAQTALALFAGLSNAAGLEDTLETYTTRVDVWIEGYRQNAILGKLADGTTTMEVNYAVSPSAVKAQVKQLVLDLMNDAAALEALSAALGDTAALYLSPDLLSWYFDAIDALPLAGDLTISRTVSLKGDTLELFLSLPMYDAQGGASTLTYVRTRGEGDLPDSNTIRMESGLRLLEAVYQEYSSMTGVNVVQGTFKSEPAAAASFSVSEEQTLADPFSVCFTFKYQTAESRDDQERDVYTVNASLTLDSDDLPATEAVLDVSFASKELKSSSTEVQAALTIGGEGWNNEIRLDFTGKSRKKWEPEVLPEERVYVSQMTQADLSALLPGAAARALVLFADWIQLPQEAQP